MSGRKIAFFVFLSCASALADQDPNPAVMRYTRVAAEIHRSFGSSIAEKRQGIGGGLAILFPLVDSGFDLGIRYAYVKEAVDREPVGSNSAFTLLTFVFDYFVWPAKLRGLFVGGEIGVTDPAAQEFYSVYSSYIFVGKLGYEYTIPNSRWSVALEARRTVRDGNPFIATRESNRYYDGITFGARYRL